jgi:hypothetical protein
VGLIVGLADGPTVGFPLGEGVGSGVGWIVGCGVGSKHWHFFPLGVTPYVYILPLLLVLDIEDTLPECREMQLALECDDVVDTAESVNNNKN